MQPSCADPRFDGEKRCEGFDSSCVQVQGRLSATRPAATDCSPNKSKPAFPRTGRLEAQLWEPMQARFDVNRQGPTDAVPQTRWPTTGCGSYHGETQDKTIASVV